MAENKIQSELLFPRLMQKKNIRKFFPRVREREDVRVMTDDSSGNIFLSGTEHIEKSYPRENRICIYGTLNFSNGTRK